jgi:hypothetical protein
MGRFHRPLFEGQRGNLWAEAGRCFALHSLAGECWSLGGFSVVAADA